MTTPETIQTTPAATALNRMIEKFDKVTGGIYDRVTDPETIAGVCEARGWHGLAKEVRDAAYYLELEKVARN